MYPKRAMWLTAKSLCQFNDFIVEQMELAEIRIEVVVTEIPVFELNRLRKSIEEFGEFIRRTEVHVGHI